MMTARQECRAVIIETISFPTQSQVQSHDLVALPYSLRNYGTRGPHLNFRDVKFLLAPILFSDFSNSEIRENWLGLRSECGYNHCAQVSYNETR